MVNYKDAMKTVYYLPFNQCLITDIVTYIYYSGGQTKCDYDHCLGETELHYNILLIQRCYYIIMIVYDYSHNKK